MFNQLKMFTEQETDSDVSDHLTDNGNRNS